VPGVEGVGAGTARQQRRRGQEQAAGQHRRHPAGPPRARRLTRATAPA
jgi:hypothetical protein